MARGKHPATFRTRKLSLSAPMVLRGRLRGRVGRRRTIFSARPLLRGRPRCISPCVTLSPDNRRTSQMSESKRPRQGGSGPDRRRGRPDQRPAKGNDRRTGRGRPTTRSAQGAGRGRDDRRRDAVPDRTEDQKIYDGPPIPDDVSAKDLDKQARQALQSLPEKLAERVSRHLVMAGVLMQDDPETAYLHALAARARASRNALIREACGE